MIGELLCRLFGHRWGRPTLGTDPHPSTAGTVVAARGCRRRSCTVTHVELLEVRT